MSGLGYILNNSPFYLPIYVIFCLSGFYCYIFSVAHASSELEDSGNILLDGSATKYEPQINITQYPLPEAIQPMSNITIYANVTDIFGEIQNATLSYSFYPNGLSRVSSMDLFYGNRSNGIFYGIIPAQNNSQEITAKYKVQLEDDLGYSAISEGEFSIPGKVKVEENNVEIKNQVKSNTTDSEKQEVTVTAYVTAFDSNATIENVTLYYTTNYPEEDEEDEEPANFTSSAMNINSSADLPDFPYEEEPSTIAYEATIGPFEYSDDLRYYLVAYDDLSRRDSSENKTYEVDPNEQEESSKEPSTGKDFLNAIDLTANIEDIDVNNLTTTLEFQLRFI